MDERKNTTDPRFGRLVEITTLPDTGVFLTVDALGRVDVTTGHGLRSCTTCAVLSEDFLLPLYSFGDGHVTPAALEAARRYVVEKYFTTHAPGRTLERRA